MTEIFAVQYTYLDDIAALDEHRPAHRAFLGELADQGELLLSGPLKAGTPSALLIVRGQHAEEVRSLLRRDPFQVQSLVTQVEVHPWNPVLGAWLPAA